MPLELPTQVELTDDELAQIITDPSVGYISAEKLQRKLKTVPLSQIKRVMATNQAYQVNQAPRTTKFNTIIASYPGDIIQADLMDVSQIATKNKGINFLLTFIDVYSRFVQVVPIRNKNQATVKSAMKVLVDSSPFEVNNLTTDDGPEFHNKVFHTYMTEAEITHYITPANTPHKLAIIERFHRTLRGMMDKLADQTRTLTFLPLLPQLINNYNSTYHRTIQDTPQNIIGGSENKQVITRVLYTLNEGDTVRRSLKKGLFDKGSKKFSDQLYTIKEAHQNSYSLVNSSGQPLARRYQGYELKLVEPDTLRLPNKDDMYQTPTKQVVKKKRLQKSEPAFNDQNTHKVNELGEVNITRRHLVPLTQKRIPRKPSKLDI